MFQSFPLLPLPPLDSIIGNIVSECLFWNFQLKLQRSEVVTENETTKCCVFALSFVFHVFKTWRSWNFFLLRNCGKLLFVKKDLGCTKVFSDWTRMEIYTCLRVSLPIQQWMLSSKTGKVCHGIWTQAFIRSFSMKVCGIVLSPDPFLIFYVSNFINYTCINLIILSHFVIRKYI